MKSCRITIRISEAERAEIQRRAHAAGQHITGYVRARALAADTTAASNDRIEKLEQTVARLVTAFVEFSRVPFFTEWRARCLAEGDSQHPHESSQAYLLRQALTYHQKFGAWPVPTDARRFGRVPPEFDSAQWPRVPPEV